MRSAFRRTVRTIDSHTEGNATGKLPLGKTLRFEGVLGTCFTGTLDGDDPLPHGLPDRAAAARGAAPSQVTA